MEGITLDLIVRNALLSKKLTLHWYAEYMHYARTCVQSLSKTYRIVENIKEQKFTVTTKFIDIPADAIDVISVFGLLHDKRKKFHYNPSISYLEDAKKDTRTIPQLQDENNGIALPITGVSLYYQVPEFDTQMTYEYGFNEDRTKIVLGYLNDATTVFVRYKTQGVDYTAATVVNSYAEDAILSYIEYQTVKSNRNKVGLVSIYEREYKANVRKLKVRLQPYGFTELAQALTYG